MSPSILIKLWGIIMNNNNNAMEFKIDSLVLSNVFGNNFEVYKALDNETRKEQISKISYIDLIARQLDKKINEINLLDHFPNKDGLLTSTDNEINKIIAGLEVSSSEEIKKYKFTESTKKTCIDIFNKQAESIRTSLKHKISRCVQSMEDIQNEYNEYIATKFTYQKQLDAITIGSDETLYNMLGDINSGNDFIISNITNSELVFETANDIICTHKHDASGVDLRVNFGKFKITIRTDDFRLRLTKVTNDFEYDDFMHPHVSSSNSLCLGNMSELFDNAVSSRNVLEMLNITKAILTNYNEGDAYAPLQNFAYVSKQVQPNGEVLKDPNAPDYEERHICCPECDHMFYSEVEVGSMFDGYCPECDYFIEGE